MIINPIISASSGLKPQIVVTAPAGSTVTCTTPGGIVIQGIEVSGKWIYANLPGPGTYTINASLGTQSKTESVIVDRVGVFEVEIIYRLYLYNLGDECTDVTGGWDIITDRDPGNGTEVYTYSKKETTYMRLYCTGKSSTAWPAVVAWTRRTNDFSSFSTIMAEVTLTNNQPDYTLYAFEFGTIETKPLSGIPSLGLWTYATGDRTLKFTLSKKSQQYVAFIVWGYGRYIQDMIIKKVWLE